jgi:hypothetical protein
MKWPRHKTTRSIKTMEQLLTSLKARVLNEPSIAETCRNMIGRRIDYQLKKEPLNPMDIERYVINFTYYSLRYDDDSEDDNQTLIMASDTESRIIIKELLCEMKNKIIN